MSPERNEKKYSKKDFLKDSVYSLGLRFVGGDYIIFNEARNKLPLVKVKVESALGTSTSNLEAIVGKDLINSAVQKYSPFARAPDILLDWGISTLLLAVIVGYSPEKLRRYLGKVQYIIQAGMLAVDVYNMLNIPSEIQITGFENVGSSCTEFLNNLPGLYTIPLPYLFKGIIITILTLFLIYRAISSWRKRRTIEEITQEPEEARESEEEGEGISEKEAEDIFPR